MAVWTDELKAELIQDYEEKDPTPETSTSIIEGLAKKYGGTVNSIRVMLSKAGVYVKVAKAATGDPDAPKRMSKSDAIDTLNAAITDLGLTPDDAITSKLTGKAALYLAGILRHSETSTDD